MQGNKHAHNDPPIQLLYIAMKKNRKITQFFAAQIFLPYPVNLQVFLYSEAPTLSRSQSHVLGNHVAQLSSFRTWQSLSLPPCRPHHLNGGRNVVIMWIILDHCLPHAHTHEQH
jgi:hypothetical protein